MDLPTNPKPGALLVTCCTPKLWAIPCHGIRFNQKFMAKVEYLDPPRRGYPPPAWRTSHVGKVMRKRGLEFIPWINDTAAVVFEVTHPHAKFTPIEEFIGNKPWYHCHRIVDGQEFEYPERALTYQQVAAIRLTSVRWRRYDIGQLLNHLVMDLYGVPMDKWTRIADFSARNKVCSAGTAYVEEFSRRSMMPKTGGVAALGWSHLGRMTSGMHEPWQREMVLPTEAGEDPRYLATERFRPADYLAHWCYRTKEYGNGARAA